MLAIAGLFISFNQLGLIVVRNQSWAAMWPVFVWIICAGGGFLALRYLLPRHDPYIFPATMLLTGWGLNIIDRLLPRYTERQTTWMAVSLLAMLVVCMLPGHLRWLQRYRYTWLLLGLILLAATIVLGVNPSGQGARLWLGAAGIYYQPSELLKILLVVFLASYLADYQPIFRRHWHTHWRYMAPVLLMWGISIVLLVWQRDLGTATIFFMVFTLMLYVASGDMLLLLGGIGLLGLAGVGAYYVFDVVALRVEIWLDPWRDADNTSFQIVQSLMAVADGGLIGAGIGQGIPNFIPVVHTDFVYAAIAEEWGLVGAIGAIAALLIIILRGLRLAALLQHKLFHGYLVLGFCLMLGVQTLLIAGGTLNLVPLTGVTLPFASYGGSSLLTCFVMVGLFLLVSSTIEGKPAYDES